MNLYAFRPAGHGPVSFYVAAEDEISARTAVVAKIADRKTTIGNGPDRLWNESDWEGWPEDYELMVYEPGQVAINPND